MVHPLYIAPDEEIISVIARLRSMEESEVTLVFPKTSAVTQSIINLKLLAREGEKLQKKMIIVSQSENARSLAEKLGFSTLPYTQDFEQKNYSFSGSAFEAPVAAPEVAAQVVTDESLTIARPRSADIGSSTFHVIREDTAPLAKKIGDITAPAEQVVESAVEESPEVAAPVTAAAAATTLRIRNATPERPPGLNSVRFQEAEKARQQVVQVDDEIVEEVAPREVPPANEMPFGTSRHFSDLPAAAPEHKKPPVHDFAPLNPAGGKPARGVFATQESAFTPKESVIAPVNVPASRTLRLALFIFGALVILTSIAVFLFLTLPSAEVKVIAQTVEDAVDQSYTVLLTGGGDITLQKRTEEVSVSIPGIASGAPSTVAGSSAVAGRAKGTLTITNSYSSEAQTLVATTRFEASDGKVYRLTKATTVPGNGSVTAEVSADKSGSEYNKSSDTFTIPGFKGSDKYVKFSATVATEITGGEGQTVATSGSGATFIRADEETLRSRAAETAKTQFTDGITNDERSEKYTFTDGLVTEMVSEQNMPKTNSVPGDYTYTAVYKVTAYTVNVADVKKLLVKNMKTDYDGITFAPKEQELSFTDFTVDEKAGTASLKAHLDASLVAVLNAATLKQDLAGKSASQLTLVTEKHPEVKNLEVTFRPSWALKRIPGNVEKITLTEITE